MSWVIGGLFKRGATPAAASVKVIHPAPLHRIVRENFYLAAGGIPETCFSSGAATSGDRVSESGWLAVGVGLDAIGDRARILSQTDWEQLLRTPNPRLEACDGHFLTLLWAEGRVTLRNDQLGMRTVHAVLFDEGVLFSTRLDWLAQAMGGADIDSRAFGSHWLAHNQLSFRPILRAPGCRFERLGQAGKMEVTPDEIHVAQRPWLPDLEAPFPERTFRRLEAFANPMVDRHIVPGLAMSGGFDSRLLLALRPAGNSGCCTFSFGSPDNPDVRIAQQVARSEGIPHIVFNAPVPEPDEALQLMQEHAGVSVGQAGVTAALHLRYYPELYRQRILMMDGGFAEIGRRTYYQRLVLRGEGRVRRDGPEITFRSLRRKCPSIFSPDVQANMMSGAIEDTENLLDEMWKLKALSFENILDLIAVRYRFPNYGGPEQGRMDAMVLAYMPFAQPSVLQSIFSLPESQRKNGRFYRQYIRSRHPSLTRVPLLRKGVELPYWVPLQAGLILSKGISMAVPKTGPDTIRQVLNHMKEFAMDLVHSSDTRTYGGYDMQALLSLVEGYYRGVRNHSAEFVDRWLSFELFRRRISGNVPD